MLKFGDGGMRSSVQLGPTGASFELFSISRYSFAQWDFYHPPSKSLIQYSLSSRLVSHPITPCVSLLLCRVTRDSLHANISIPTGRSRVLHSGHSHLLQPFAPEQVPKPETMHDLVGPLLSKPHVAQKGGDDNRQPHDGDHGNKCPVDSRLGVFVVDSASVVENRRHDGDGDRAAERIRERCQAGDGRRHSGKVSEGMERPWVGRHSDTKTCQGHHAVDQVDVFGIASPGHHRDTDSRADSPEK